MEHDQKIAVLIDADNTQLAKLEAVLRDLSTYGRIVVKKAYGNWKKDNLKNWEGEVKRLAIKTEQQFDYVPGKNATDIAMVIDAMDLLHNGLYDVYALVSSDSDFTSLAIRLRESGPYVIGVGEQKTPEAFRNACDEFLLLEYVNLEATTKAGSEALLGRTAETETSAESRPAPRAEEPPINEIHTLLQIAADRYENEDGYANLAAVGAYIKRAKPDFTPAAYGFARLPALIEAFPKRYKMARLKGKNNAEILAYRCL